MSSKFAETFFKSFFSRFDDKNSIAEKYNEIITRENCALVYCLISTKVLDNFVYALQDALKDYVADKNSKSKLTNKHALYYMKKNASDGIITAASALLAEISDLLLRGSTYGSVKDVDPIVAHTMLRNSVSALIVKLKSADIADKPEQKEEKRAADQVKNGQKKNYLDLDDSVYATSQVEKVAAFGNYVLEKLAEMEKISNKAFQMFNTNPGAALLQYSRDLLRKLKDERKELNSAQNANCSIM